MRYWFLACALLAVAAITPAAAQVYPESIYAFDIDVEETNIVLEPGEKQAAFQLVFTDLSKDTPDSFTGGDTEIGIYDHRTKFTVSFAEGDIPKGWGYAPPPPIRTYGGETKDLTFIVQLQPTQIVDPQVTFILNATHTTLAGKSYTNIPFTVLSPGPNTYNALLQGAVQMEPNKISSAIIQVTNSALTPREFVFELGENACDLRVGYEQLRVIPGKGKAEISVTILGPDDKFWYSAQICPLKLDVFPMDEPGNVRTLGLDPMISGTQVNPVWIFNTVGVILAGLVIFLIVARRKARIEEEILGRPQKPWLIPVEMVYLEHLKERDPQAHYVVRHFLMEEEYQSSLLWYANFKRATRGARSKERLVVSQEHKYERFKKRWQRKIAAPLKKVDRLSIKLQKKLDRQGKAGLRQEKRKWKKLTKKMSAAHKNKVAKATEKWEKQKAKAEKKNREIPAKPVIAEPAYPAEPSGDRLLLEHHKWQKKVVKTRTRATKKVGNLEVKFEKKDAKMLRKVRRKVNKIARKLDDPEFAAEHPLLASASE